MRAIKIAPDRSLRLADVREPTLKAEQVRVEVTFCGICGSDLHLCGSGIAPAGTIMGHELSGRISELGADVEGWEIGDRVCVLPFASCGECEYCAAGDEQLCAANPSTALGLGLNRGAYAETVVAWPSMLRRLPDGLNEEHAALAEPLAVGLHGVAIAATDPADPAVVIGMGPIGVMTAIGLRARGFERVLTIEPNRRRRERAEALGFAVAGPDRAKTGIAALGERPPRAVFECAGTAAAVGLAVELVGPGGRIVVLGIHDAPAPIPLLDLLAKEAQLRTAFAYSGREFDEAVALLAAGEIPATELITAVVPLEETPDAFADLLRPETEQLKVLLRP